jgi:hypothetical protein
MTNARKHSRIPIMLLAVFSLLSLRAAAQEKKEFNCTVLPGAVISITNNYGPISVKPSGSSQVLVETVSHSDTVSLVNEQHGDRIALRSTSSAREPISWTTLCWYQPRLSLACDRPTAPFAHKDCAATWSSKPLPVRWK